MVAVIVRHRVKDYDTWKPLFDEHGEVRRRYGATGHQIYRLSGDPNDLTIVNLFKDEEGARGFMADPSLPVEMERGGVVSAPEVSVGLEAETAEYTLAIA